MLQVEMNNTADGNLLSNQNEKDCYVGFGCFGANWVLLQ